MSNAIIQKNKDAIGYILKQLINFQSLKQDKLLKLFHFILNDECFFDELESQKLKITSGKDKISLAKILTRHFKDYI